MNQEIVIILVTAPNRTEAEQIGQCLVEKKLIACCNILDPIFSIFHWKGEICREDEVLLILKTVRDNIHSIIKTVKKHHSYDTPEIIAIPVISGSEDYLNWIKQETECT